jgi:hypothetical protein
MDGVFGSFDIAMPTNSPVLCISAIFDGLLTITGRGSLLAASRGRGAGLMDLCWDYIGHCTNWKIWTNESRALGQSAVILTEKSRANSAKSLANVSCHERGKKYLTWQNASNAEPPPGIDERHLPARGKPILVSAIYFPSAASSRPLVLRQDPDADDELQADLDAWLVEYKPVLWIDRLITY